MLRRTHRPRTTSAVGWLDPSVPGKNAERRREATCLGGDSLLGGGSEAAPPEGDERGLFHVITEQ